jgi:sulfur relay (sulfurtransferase) complex TusBCD TusD component (DsrE family)
VHLRKSRGSPSEFSKSQWLVQFLHKSQVTFRICTEEIKGLAEREGRATWARRAYALKSDLGELRELITTWTKGPNILSKTQMRVWAHDQSL